MDVERQQVLEKLKVLVSENYEIPICKPIPKSSGLSAEVRNDANKIFNLMNHTVEEHQLIMNMYSKSIALAPLDSEELALAYSNRSAMLFHMKEYKECVMNIDKALELVTLNHLRVKLYCRKVQCLTALGLSGNRDTFEKAVECYHRVTATDNKKQILASMITVTKTTLDLNKQHMMENYDSRESIQKILLKKERQDLFNFVEMKYSEEHGRHLVAVRDIRPGDVIMVEKPIAVFPSDLTFLYCAHCLSLALTGIPCDHCTWCLFCSEECKKEAWEEYHELECPIISHVTEPKSSSMCLKLALRIFILMIKKVGSIEKLKAELNNIDVKKDKFRCYSTSNIDNLIKFIYTLSSNDSNKFANDILEDLSKSLLCIIQFPPFSENSEIVDFKLVHLDENENLLFIGAFLLKLTKIMSSNKFIVKSLFRDDSSFHLKKNKLEPSARILGANPKGVSLQLIGSFFNNSCWSPNAEKFYINGSKVVAYAVEPIKKNSQIFISYMNIYHENYDIQSSKNYLKQCFDFSCQCMACNNNFSIKTRYEVWSLYNTSLREIFRVFEPAISVISNRNHNFEDFINSFKKIKKLIEVQFNSFDDSDERLDLIKRFISLAYFFEYAFGERVFKSCAKI